MAEAKWRTFRCDSRKGDYTMTCRHAFTASLALLLSLGLAAAEEPVQAASAEATGPTVEEESVEEGRPARGFVLPWTPLQLGVAGNWQIFRKDTPVRGLRLGLLSDDTKDVAGISLAGVVSRSERRGGIEAAPVAHGGRLRGLSLAGVSLAKAEDGSGPAVRGFQASVAYNRAKGDTQGLQLSSGVNRTAGDLTGPQVGGLVSTTAGDLTGLQVGGLVSTTARNLSGPQVGGLVSTTAGNLTGLQIGGAGQHNCR